MHCGAVKAIGALDEYDDSDLRTGIGIGCMVSLSVQTNKFIKKKCLHLSLTTASSYS